MCEYVDHFPVPLSLFDAGLASNTSSYYIIAWSREIEAFLL
jgi:hypothetical protein